MPSVIGTPLRADTRNEVASHGWVPRAREEVPPVGAHEGAGAGRGYRGSKAPGRPLRSEAHDASASADCALLSRACRSCRQLGATRGRWPYRQRGGADPAPRFLVVLSEFRTSVASRTGLFFRHRDEIKSMVGTPEMDGLRSGLRACRIALRASALRQRGLRTPDAVVRRNGGAGPLAAGATVFRISTLRYHPVPGPAHRYREVGASARRCDCGIAVSVHTPHRRWAFSPGLSPHRVRASSSTLSKPTMGDVLSRHGVGIQ